MKAIYKFVLFLAMFQMMVLIVNATGVFPKDGQLYSDVEVYVSEGDDSGDAAWRITQAFFVPSTDDYGLDEGLTIPIIVGLFVVGGGLAAFITHSFIPIAIIFLCYVFFTMLLNSYSFLSKLFNYGDSDSLIYLGICIGVSMFIIFVITIAETPTHGRSG